jgi:hypothetical protein
MNPPAPSPNSRPAAETCPFTRRAMAIWPRLDRRTLARCGCDPHRIAAFVAHRTSLPIEVITAILEDGERVENHPSFYFG